MSHGYEYITAHVEPVGDVSVYFAMLVLASVACLGLAALRKL
jgi:hypothetical protein